MEIKKLFFAVIRKSWLIVILAFLGGGITGFISIYTSVPAYVAETSIYSMNHSKVSLTGESVNSQDISLGRQLLNEYSQIINSRKVMSLALRELKISGLTEEALNRMISLNLKKDSSVMVVRAISSNPQMSADVANAVSRAFTSKIRELTNNDSIGILDDAQVPDYPISNGHLKKLLLGVLAGIAIAFSLIYIIELFDTTIRDEEEVEHELKLRVIGIIPKHDMR